MPKLLDRAPEVKQEPVAWADAPGEEDMVTMDDAIAAGDAVLMNEQAALLRECRAALDALLEKQPKLSGVVFGSTTLGNLRAELGAYRPQGVFGAPNAGNNAPPTATATSQQNPL